MNRQARLKLYMKAVVDPNIDWEALYKLNEELSKYPKPNCRCVIIPPEAEDDSS